MKAEADHAGFVPRVAGWLRVGAFAAVSAIVFHFGVISDAPLPDHYLIVNYNDVLLHFAAFGLLTVCALAVFPGRKRLVLLCLLMAGSMIEMVQMLEPEREASLKDLAANAGGVALGAVLYLALGRASRLMARARMGAGAGRG